MNSKNNIELIPLDLDDYFISSKNLIKSLSEVIQLGAYNCDQIKSLLNFLLNSQKVDPINSIKDLGVLEKFRTMKVEFNPKTIEDRLKVSMDMKLNFKQSQYAEDGDLLAISDSSKILVYSANKKKNICRIKNNASPCAGLISRLGYLVYFDKKKFLVVYNIKNKHKDCKLRMIDESPIKYMKISPDSKCIGVKFENHKVFLLKLKGRRLSFLSVDIFNKNFIYSDKKHLLYLFDSNIDLYDYKRKRIVTRVQKNNLRIDFITIIDDNKTLIFSDKEKFKIIDLESNQIKFKIDGNLQLYHLSKDFKYLCNFSSSTLKLSKNVITNSITHESLINQNISPFIPHSSSNIFCEKSFKADKNNSNPVLQSILNSKKFINNDHYSELLIQAPSSIHKLYWSKRKKYVYSWPRSDWLNYSRQEINFYSSLRYYNEDYFVFVNKTCYQFWSIQDQRFDRFFIEQDLTKDPERKESRFALTRTKKIMVLPNWDFTQSIIFKFQGLERQILTELPPIVDEKAGIMVVIRANEVSVVDLKSLKIKNKVWIEVSQNKPLGWFCVMSRFVYLVYAKKMKVIDVEGTVQSKKIKIGLVKDLQELQFKDLEGLIVFKRRNSVVISDASGFGEDVVAEVENLAEINEVKLVKERNLIVFTVDCKQNNEKLEKILFLYNYNSKMTVKKVNLDERFPIYSLENNGTLIYLQDQSLVFFSLSTLQSIHSKIIESPVSKIQFLTSHILLSSSTLCLLNKEDPSLAPLFLNSYQTNHSVSSSSSGLLILNQGEFIITDSDLNQKFSFKFEQSLKYFKTINDRFIILYDEEMNFYLFDLHNGFSLIIKFSLPQEELEEFHFRLAGNMLFVFGNKFYAKIDTVSGFVRCRKRIRYGFYFEERNWFVCKDLSEAIHVVDAASDTDVEFVKEDCKMVVYDSEEKIAYVKDIRMDLVKKMNAEIFSS